MTKFKVRQAILTGKHANVPNFRGFPHIPGSFRLERCVICHGAGWIREVHMPRFVSYDLDAPVKPVSLKTCRVRCTCSYIAPSEAREAIGRQWKEPKDTLTAREDRRWVSPRDGWTPRLVIASEDVNAPAPERQKKPAR